VTDSLRTRSSDRTWIAAVGAILGAAVWVRLTSLRHVLVGDEVMPMGGDSAYHLHRAMQTAEGFPRVPVHDPLMNWPDGGPCHWAPGFDFLLALPAALTGSTGTSAAVLAAGVPVILGLPLLIVAILLGRRLLPDDAIGRAAALVAGVALVALPQAASLARFGRTDHHVAESLTMALLGAWAVLWDAQADPRSRLRWELAGAVVAAAGLWTFAGSVLYVAIACVVLGVRLLLAERVRLVGSGAPALLVASAVTAAVYVPTIAEHGHVLSYVYPSWLQPALLLVAAAGLAVLVGVGRALPGAGSGVAVRRAGAGLVVGALVVGGLLLTPAGAVVLDGLTGFVGRSDPWLARIGEFQPLTVGWPWSPGFWAGPQRFMGAVGFVAPVALALVGVLAVRDPARLGPFALWTGLLFVLALQQGRFLRVAHVNLAIVLALSVDQLARAVAERGVRVPPLVLPLLVAVGVVLDPASRAFLSPKPARAPSAVEECAAFLDIRGEPVPDDAGVLVAWDLGHELTWLGGRPVVTNGFGSFLNADGFREVDAAWTSSQSEVDALMDRRRLGWLVSGPAAPPSGRGSPGPFERLPDGRGVPSVGYLRHLPLAPLVVGGTGLPDGSSAHLEHLRPVFASSGTVGGLAVPLPVLFVYQRVPGARLEGAGTPGDRVVLRADLDVRGLAWPWFASTTVAADGRWTIVTPIATGTTGTITTPTAALVKVGDAEPVPVEVPLSAVMNGARVATVHSVH